MKIHTPIHIFEGTNMKKPVFDVLNCFAKATEVDSGKYL